MADRPDDLKSAAVAAILRDDLLRWRVLEIVRSLSLPDCWVAAGFVRNAVWDHLHKRPAGPLLGDVDVIWFDPSRTDPGIDLQVEALLHVKDPAIAWSVKNQARMHHRNGDEPYASAVDAMRYWPETATAVAARRVGISDCQIEAPAGLDDLLDLIVRPTPAFAHAKRRIFEDRVADKKWLKNWPLLQFVT